MRDLRLSFLLAATVCAYQSVYAQSVWTGANLATDKIWSDAANWTGGAPGPSSTVTFNDGGYPLTTNAQGVINNIVSASATIASLTYNNLTTDYITTEIPSGTTLIISGIGAPSTGALSIGASDAASAINNVVTITGGGSLYAGTNGTSLFSAQSGTGSGSATLLDLSGLTNFSFNFGGTSPGAFSLGTGGSGSGATVNFAAVSNNITASTLNMGDNNTRGVNTINLGNGTNIINADTINMGVSKTSGTMQFLNNAGGGLTIANHTGTGRATINLGTEASTGSTTAEATGIMALNGGVVNILAGTLTLGNRVARADSPGASGALSFNNGTVDATTILMALNTSGGGSPFGTLSVGNSGVLKIGTGGLSLVNEGGTAGAGSLIITNGGTVICSNNIYNSTSAGTNTITISSGSLTMASAGGSIGVSNGIPLENFNLTNATLTLPILGGSSPDVVVTSFNPDIANTINIDFLPSITSYPTQFEVITYTAPAGGNPGIITLGSLPSGFSGYISNNTANASIDLVLTKGPAAKMDLWTGAVNTVWDLTTLNWSSNGQPVNYLDLDFVTFDDTAHTGTVNITGPRLPVSVTFNNNQTNYVLAGSGKIGGLTQMTLNGSGSVTLAETGGDNFSGGVVVNQGKLILDDTNSAISGGLYIGGGAIVQIGANDASGALPAGVLDDEGTLVYNRSNSVTVSVMIPGGGGLSQLGSGTTTLAASNTFFGNTIIDNGTLALSGSGSLFGSQDISVTNAVLDVSGVSAVDTLFPTLNLTAATLNVKVGYLQTNLTVSTLSLAGLSNVINVRSLPPIAYYPATNTLLYAPNGISGYNFVLGSLPAASPAYAGSIALSSDGTSVLLTLTAGPIGVRPSVTWSGVDALANVSTNWTDAQNWETPGVPAAAEKVAFSDAGTTGGIPFNSPGDGDGGIVNPSFIDNVVDVSLTNASLTYANTAGAHNTLIAPGKTLTENGSLAVTGASGTVSILGAGGILQINNPGNATTLNVENSSGPTLDMSGLDTFTAAVSQIGIGYDIASGGTSVSGTWYLARTNTITTGPGSTGNGSALVVGGCSTTAGETGVLYLGQTNVLYVDGIVLGTGDSINNLITFNPILTNPVIYIRGISGSSSRVTTWSLGDDTVNLNNHIGGSGQVNDFTAGTLNALVSHLIIGQGSQGNEVINQTIGTFNMGAGILDVTTLNIGLGGVANGGTGIGIMNVTNSTLIVNSLALAVAGGERTNTAGTLNLTNSTLIVSNGIAVGTGTGGGNLTFSASTVKLLNDGVIASPVSPLANLILDGATLQMDLNGNDSVTDIVATAVGTGAPSTINLGTILNVSGSVQIPILSYTGTDPYPSLSLGTYPAGYTATLVDDTANSSIDVSIASLVKPAPHITGVSVSGATLTLTATNGAASGQYILLGTTNLAKPFSQWTPVLTNNFNASGNLTLSTNIINPLIPRQFYLLSQ